MDIGDAKTVDKGKRAQKEDLSTQEGVKTAIARYLERFRVDAEGILKSFKGSTSNNVILPDLLIEKHNRVIAQNVAYCLSSLQSFSGEILNNRRQDIVMQLESILNGAVDEARRKREYMAAYEKLGAVFEQIMGDNDTSLIRECQKLMLRRN